MTRLIVDQEELQDGADHEGDVFWGYHRWREGLIQLLATQRYGVRGLTPLGRLNPEKPDPARLLELPLGNRMIPFELYRGFPMPTEIAVVDVRAGLDARRAPVLGASLADKTVAIFGVGSIGSNITSLLAQAGVGRFTLVDRDRLDAANLSRHACGHADLGRAKVEAVADLVRARLGDVQVEERDVRDLAHAGALRETVASADCVIASMDSLEAQLLVNETCLAMRKPGLFVQAYERACAGEVVVVVPGRGPCAFCVIGFRDQITSDVAVKSATVAYQDADATAFVAEPGLAIDIAHISSVAAAHALGLLQPDGAWSGLINPARPLFLVHGGSTPRGPYEKLFASPFDFLRVRTSEREPCPVCGWTTPSTEV